MPRRLLIVDDHQIVRTGVRALLAGVKHWEVCGEAGNGLEAILKVQQTYPDAVLLDLTMPEMNGFEAAIRIHEIAPAVKLIFFSMHTIPTSIKSVTVDGFVSKASAERDLLFVLDSVTGNPA